MKSASILYFIRFTNQCIIETIHIKGVFIMSSAKTKNLTPIYAFIQGLYWMNFAAIMGYSGFYLLGSGFSNTEIGIIIAIAGIRRQIASGVDILIHLGRMRDKSRKVLEITEICGFENHEIKTRTLYRWQEGKGLVQTAELLNREKLVRAGVTI